MGLSSSGKRRLRGDLIALYSFLRRGSEEGDADLFSLVSSDRKCGNDSKLHQRKFRLNASKHFFERAVKHWNRLLWLVVNALSLLVFKRHLDKRDFVVHFRYSSGRAFEKLLISLHCKPFTENAD